MNVWSGGQVKAGDASELKVGREKEAAAGVELSTPIPTVNPPKGSAETTNPTARL